MEARRYIVRAHERTSMFVLASMSAASATGPVKIRNMSPAGAMIEGESLPGFGERLELRRGALVISGRVVWRQPGKAGLCFDSDARVADWLPARASSKQQEVDRTVQRIKEGRAGPLPERPPENANPPVSQQELIELAEAVDKLGDHLAGDPHVISAHGAQLQTLDITSQILRRLAALR